MSKATLTLASKNYGSWSLRGWLLCKMANLDFEEQHVSTDDPSTRAELLLLSPSFLVPCLTHDGLKVWDTLAIAEYLHEISPGSRAVAGRSGAARALPLDLRRNAFRLLQSALGAADEHQGAFSRLQILGRRPRRHRAHHHDLARMSRPVWRPLSVRQKALCRGCHVCAGLLALRHLRRPARRGLAGLLPHHHGDAVHRRNGSPAPKPSPTSSRSSTSSSEAGCPARLCLPANVMKCRSGA